VIIADFETFFADFAILRFRPPDMTSVLLHLTTILNALSVYVKGNTFRFIIALSQNNLPFFVYLCALKDISLRLLHVKM